MDGERNNEGDNRAAQLCWHRLWFLLYLGYYPGHLYPLKNIKCQFYTLDHIINRSFLPLKELGLEGPVSVQALGGVEQEVKVDGRVLGLLRAGLMEAVCVFG